MDKSYLSVIEAARALLSAWYEPVDGASVASVTRHMMRVAECVEILKLVLAVYDAPPGSEIAEWGLVDDASRGES